MSVLDKNLKPGVTYKDIYGSLTISIRKFAHVVEQGNEIPFIKDANFHEYVDKIPGWIPEDIHVDDCSIESMIATVLSSIFCTNIITVLPATPIYDQPAVSPYTWYTAIIGGGYYNNQPVTSCGIELISKTL